MGKQYLLSGRQCGWDNQATLPIEQPCQDFSLIGTGYHLDQSQPEKTVCEYFKCWVQMNKDLTFDTISNSSSIAASGK
jgi:hypothetical protein